MRNIGKSHTLGCLLVVVSLTLASQSAATEIEVAGLKLDVPGSFERQRPRSEIIAYEFSAPAKDSGQPSGRLTVMSAGGSVQQNVDRWFDQFTQTDGKSTKDVAQVEKKQLGRYPVHFVDIAGTYDDKPGPFAPGVKRADYRMLGAIVETQQGNVFFKFYGPAATVAEHAAAFRDMFTSALGESK